jgi:hypothetical protein
MSFWGNKAFKQVFHNFLTKWIKIKAYFVIFNPKWHKTISATQKRLHLA